MSVVLPIGYVFPTEGRVSCGGDIDQGNVFLKDEEHLGQKTVPTDAVL